MSTIEEDELKELKRRALRPDGALCQNCRWFEFDKYRKYEGRFDPSLVYSDATGECRRHAPRPISSLVREIGDLIGRIAWTIEEIANIKHDEHTDYALEMAGIYETRSWPVVDVNDWCGEFSKKVVSEQLERREAPEVSGCHPPLQQPVADRGVQVTQYAAAVQAPRQSSPDGEGPPSREST